MGASSSYQPVVVVVVIPNCIFDRLDFGFVTKNIFFIFCYHLSVGLSTNLVPSSLHTSLSACHEKTLSRLLTLGDFSSRGLSWMVGKLGDWIVG